MKNILLFVLFFLISCDRITSPFYSLNRNVYYLSSQDSQEHNFPDVFSMNYDGTDKRNLTRNLAPYKQIYAYSVSSGSSSMYIRYYDFILRRERNVVLDIESGIVEGLELDGIIVDYATLSPDGSKLLFNSSVSHELECLTYCIKTKTIFNLTECYSTYHHFMDPIFSLDGKHICLNADGDIFVIRSDGTNLVKLTDKIEHQGFSSYDFSPDSRKVVILSQMISEDFNIYIVNIDGSNYQKVLSIDSTFGSDVDCYDVSFSSAGEAIYFKIYGTLQGKISTYIFKINLETGAIRQITDGQFYIKDYDISPNDKYIFYTGYDVGYSIYRIDITGKNQSQLTDHSYTAVRVNLVPMEKPASSFLID